MADVSDILGTPQSAPVATVDAPDTATIPMQDIGSTVNVNAPDPTTVATDPGQPSTAMIAGQPNPAYQDPEIAMASVHHNWLGKILDSVGTILGGDKTIVATKHPDGSISVEHNPSTSSEKWGRVAQAALGGAARGMAAGQGPGGAGKAFAAGAEAGLKQPQQALDAANSEAANMSQQQLRNAQNIALNQQIFKTSWDNSHLDADYLQKQSTEALAQAKAMEDIHAVPIATGIKNGAEVVQYGKTNPAAVGSHLGKDGSMLYNIPDGHGGVNVYQIPANIANRLTTEDDPWTATVLDPKDGTKTIDKPDVTLAGQETYGQRATRRMALIVSNSNSIKSAQAASSASVTAAAAKTRADAAATEAGQKAPLIRAQTAEQENLASLHGAQKNLIQGGSAAAGGAGAGLTGEAYLQAAVDPAMQNQVRATAKGDLKMPTASRSPANQAFRNAVMNYDNTYTDARYAGKQQFKTGTESTKLNQLSTGLEHLESAMSHADYNPLLPYSDKATAYAEDIKHFTQESGKYIKSGALTQGEYDDLMTKANSNIPSVREAALKEKANLLGGKVRASFQQYRAATGQDLPVQEFFDPDTRARLTRYALTPAAANTEGGAPPIEKVPPGHDTTFGNGQVWRNVNGTAVRVK